MTTQQTAVHIEGGSEGYRKLIEVGIALSSERDHDRLMERILIEAKEMCNADGGTLYLRGRHVLGPDGETLFEANAEGDLLKFEIMRTDSLGIAMGGTTDKPIAIPPLPLYDAETGEPNHHAVATHTALSGEAVNIPDAYRAEGFDFTGAKNFDKQNGYRSTSFLTMPLKNHEGDVTGVLSLLNATDADSGEVIPFSPAIQPLIEALASQAAIALDNQQLLQAQKELLDSFIKMIAGAIDAKSPYTGGHCERVPEIAMLLAEAAGKSDDPAFRDFDLDEEERYEMEIASLLHDCGKVTTPEYVVDKATKLETINDRIHEVRTRFEVLKRDARIEYLEALLEGKTDAGPPAAELEQRLARIDDDFAFIAECNIGGEFMAPEKVERVRRIAETTWTRTLDDRLGISHGELSRKDRTPKRELPAEEPLLDDREDHIIERTSAMTASGGHPIGINLDAPEHGYNLGEVYNLCIPRGTLTAEDRFKINDHIVQTIVMLEKLPFPKNLRRVPEYAGGHHEKLDGTGYPRKLKKEDMSIPARIMVVADIFEALTAADRPYKKPKTLSESIRIMSFMVKDRHIDPDIFRLFLTSGIFRDYADKYLMPHQIDEVDTDHYLNPGKE